MIKNKAFTLIELLIVVAIIAILAAIAVPNFLEAQTRSKVSRARADMRSAATALESYYIDYNVYPYDGYSWDGSTRMTAGYDYNFWFLPAEISTPIAYMTSAKLVDPFRKSKPGGGNHWQFDDVRYRCTQSTWGTKFDELGPPAGESSFLDEIRQDQGGWGLVCIGPDYYYGPSGSSTPSLFGLNTTESWETGSGYPDHPQPYDPTNGTVSPGDILRTQINPSGLVNVN